MCLWFLVLIGVVLYVVSCVCVFVSLFVSCVCFCFFDLCVGGRWVLFCSIHAVYVLSMIIKTQIN